MYTFADIRDGASSMQDLGGGLELWRGYFRSILGGGLELWRGYFHTPPRSPKIAYIICETYLQERVSMNGCQTFHTESATPKPPVPEWSSDQLKWLEDQMALYSLACQYDDLLEFWPSLFDIFFACWPIIPESEVLTTEQQHSLFQAEEQRKLGIKAWFEQKKTNSMVPLTIMSVSADGQMVLHFEEPFEEAFNRTLNVQP
ncbi:hypothetical protein F4604DRAFT_1687780 [Suillus subluteus]|nr:hypothetical protein F4604DRAFT_1687780 [Suillus subluteus]